VLGVTVVLVVMRVQWRYVLRRRSDKTLDTSDNSQFCCCSLHSAVSVSCSSYRQDLPEGQLCLYFVYSWADFGVFHPAGATRCTDQGQIWQGGADHRTIGPLLTAKFDLDRFRVGGLRPPKLKEIRILPI